MYVTVFIEGFLIWLLFNFFLTVPVYYWTVAGVPQFEKPRCRRFPFHVSSSDKHKHCEIYVLCTPCGCPHLGQRTTPSSAVSLCAVYVYSGRKITQSLWNVTVRGGKYVKSKGGARLSTVCLSMYSITENIYYSQLSSVAILLQPEPVFTSYNTTKELCALSLCAIVLRSFSHVSTSNGQRSSQLFCVHYKHSYWPQTHFTKRFMALTESYGSVNISYIFILFLLLIRKHNKYSFSVLPIRYPPFNGV
jgi:hypothetical protein